jgi:hypothetical protein
MYQLMLLALLPQADAATKPVWLDSYGQARAQGASEERPVLVIVAAGEEGYQKIAREGRISKTASELLASQFVCVHVDSTTEAGQKLARAFGLTRNLGIIISDKSGKYQAFFHEGNLSEGNLVRYLQRYGDPNRVFLTTETNPGDHGPAQSCPTCSSCANGRCR